MERKTVAKWLLVAALACLGLFVLGGIAAAQEEGTTVQGSQTSTDAVAETGTTTGENTAAFNGGPSAVGGDGASSQQLGQNSATVSQRGSAKSGDPVAGGQVTGVVGANATVQNQNFADAPSAISGDAEVVNDAEVNVGPSALSDLTAQVSHLGDNSADITQESEAATGDAVAGSQVTGIVGDGEHTVQNQSTALDAEALSGEAIIENVLAASAGPFAEADETAQTGQVGDNDAVLSQSSEAQTGDALAGAGVTGLVGGSATVQNQNTSSGGVAETGTSEVLNTLEALGLAVAGPNAAAFTAQATQNGDNSVDVTQDVTAGSGDALAGSQVTGAVGDEGGFLTVQNQQASEGDESITGDVDVTNEQFLTVGPAALDADVANASQLGDNDVTIAQTVEAETGDALAGAQVLGDVGHEDVTAQQSNFADGPIAESGVATGDGNLLEAAVGPIADLGSASQIGDNGVSADQTVDLGTGDAVAGGQIVGVVAAGSTIQVQGQNTALEAEATTGDIDVGSFNLTEIAVGVTSLGDIVGQASQNGDNNVALSQDVEAASGDAVAGGQVTGLVDDSAAEVDVQNQNSSDGSIAISGVVAFDVANETLVSAGPLSEGDDSAQASQLGDNAISADQTVELGTGDAVAGGQITGAVLGDGSDVDVQNQNNSIADEAESGAIEGGDANDLILSAGPSADVALATEVSQIGDNVVDANQAVEAASGDAVAGGQIAGLVSGDGTDANIQEQNTSEDALATSGDALFDTLNLVEFDGNTIGPDAGVDADVAQATQNGDNSVSLGQTADVSSGDAVGAGQVTGAVVGSGSDLTVQNSNSCVACAEVISGEVDLGDGNLIEVGGVGPFAEALDSASASQIGDNDVVVDQAIEAASGDAVSGSQVTGAVAGGGSDVTVQNQNSSVESIAETGSVVGAENLLAIDSVGPSAFADVAAQASQVGDDSLVFSQDVTAASGDAVAGSQVTGVVGPSDSDIQVQNSDDASEGISGDVDALNEASGNLTPVADSAETAHASLSGDSSFDGNQSLSTETGDAVGGAQINGVVGSDGSTSASLEAADLPAA